MGQQGSILGPYGGHPHPQACRAPTHHSAHVGLMAHCTPSAPPSLPIPISDGESQQTLLMSSPNRL